MWGTPARPLPGALWFLPDGCECGADVTHAWSALAPAGVALLVVFPAHGLDHVAAGLLAPLARGDAVFHDPVRGRGGAMLGTASARLAAGAAGLDHEGTVPRYHGRRERTKCRTVDDHLRHLGVFGLAGRGLGDAVVERLVARGFAVAAGLGT